MLMSEVKLYPAQTQFAFDLLNYNRNSLHPNATKYKFREGHISYGDKITVAGEYTNKKFLAVWFDSVTLEIGNEIILKRRIKR